jgi:NADP-dependent 3-hydroxy acid dehydrogenase YdfG
MSTPPVIIVTGASSGIGAATARLFAREGYRVVLAARRIDRLNTLEKEIRSIGGEALPVATDLSQLEDIQNLVKLSMENYGQIDILFNNAGFGRLDWLEKLDPRSDLQDLIQVNVLGVLWMSQAVLPHMIERRSGHIINMSSVGGLVAPPTYCSYSASKFAVRGFTEALRREVRIYGISVSGIYPGGVATEFDQKAHIHRKTGVTTPPWLLLNAEDVAQSVFSLTRHPRRMLVIPWPLQLAAWFNGLFPGIVDWAVEKLFVRQEKP